MSKERQTSVNNAERSGLRCTSTGRNERVMVLEGGRVDVAGTGRKLNVSVFSSIRQPWVPQGLCKVDV